MANTTPVGVEAVVENFESFERRMAAMEKRIQKTGSESSVAAKKSSELSTAISGMAKVAAIAGIGILVNEVIDFGKASIDVASDVEEMNSKFNIVFGKSAPSARAELERFAREANRSGVELQGMAATLQDTFVPLGFARDAAAGLSTEMVKLAVDVGSFNNISSADVARDFQSAIVGNTETVRKYGIVITQVTLDQELLNMGVEGGVKAATEEEKALARVNLILKGTTDAQGDAIETAGSFANVTEGLNAALTDLQVTIGNKLIPTATGFSKAFTDVVRKTDDWIKVNDAAKNSLLTGNTRYAETINLLEQYRTGAITLEEVLADFGGTIEEVNDESEKTAPTFEGVGDSAREMGEKARLAENALRQLAVSNVEHKNTLDLVKEAVDNNIISQEDYEFYTLKLKDDTDALTESEKASLRAKIDAKIAQDEYNQALEDQRQAAANAAIENVNLALSFKDITEAQFARKAIEELNKAIAEDPENKDRYLTAIREIGLSSGELDEKAIALAEDWPKFFAALKAGVIPAEESDAALASFQENAGNVDLSSIIADFSTFNEDFVTNWLTGLESSDKKTGEFEKSATDAATGIQNAYSTPPWEDVGSSIGEDLDSGFTDTKDDVVETAEEGAEEMSEEFTDIDWYGIGSEAAADIADGFRINIGDLGTAASEAASEVNDALDDIQRTIEITVIKRVITEDDGVGDDDGDSYNNPKGVTSTTLARALTQPMAQPTASVSTTTTTQTNNFNLEVMTNNNTDLVRESFETMRLFA